MHLKVKYIRSVSSFKLHVHDLFIVIGIYSPRELFIQNFRIGIAFSRY